MSAVVGKVWGWVRPALSFRPWPGSSNAPVPLDPPAPVDTVTTDGQKTGGPWGSRVLPSWVWGGHTSDQKSSDQTKLAEEFWEAEEKLQPMDIEELSAGRKGHAEAESKAEYAPRWWNKILPSSYTFWSSKTESHGLRQRNCGGWNQTTWDTENEGDFSDYGTPPPSPTPGGSSPLSATFQIFAQSWKGDVLPDHYEICFNLLRHMFDLVVVGFLWTVSPPSKLILEVLGVHGAMRLWLHGMAMFFVSTVGMAGLLWLIQEYLPLVALIYGIIQMLVISVSVRQSVILGGEEDEVEGKEDEALEGGGIKDNVEQREEAHVYSTVDRIMP